MSKITRLSELNLSSSYSYKDYLSWGFDEAVELIKGKIVLMSPAPNLNHQSISMRLSGILYSFLKKRPCKVFAAPFDVRFYDRKKPLVSNTLRR